MKKKLVRQILTTAVAAAVTISSSSITALADTVSEIAGSTTSIEDLKSDDLESPIALDDKTPAFSWRMDSNLAGQAQSAYQIVVKDSAGTIFWDTGKVESNESDIVYAGKELAADSTYTWDLTVWDLSGKTYQKSSTFGTGLMSGDMKVSEGVLDKYWDGADFIGSKQMTLDAASDMMFDIDTDFQIKSGSDASVIFGADDFRLNNKFQNVWNLEGTNYVRIEIDTSGIQADGTGAKINVYCPGYRADASETEPYKSYDIPAGVFTPDNVNEKHTLAISCSTSAITPTIDGKAVLPEVEGRRGKQPGSIVVSQLKSGNNYNTFPNLNSVGFAAKAGTEVEFSNYQIKATGKTDADAAVQFDADTGATYAIWDGIDGIKVGDNLVTVSGGESGVVGYADPSCGSETMVRKEFSTAQGKEIASAKLYTTAQGILEYYINGKRVGEDYFVPGDSQYRETLTYTAYDVTDMLQGGDNAMGAILSGGWYTGWMTFTPGNYNFFGNMPALLSKLEISYTDGTTDTVVTDDSWQKYTDGPVMSASYFQGESYDSAKDEAVEGWSTADYDAKDWTATEDMPTRDWIDPKLQSRFDEPVRVYETETAQKVLNTHSEDNESWIYDFGDDLSAFASVKVPTDTLKAGDTIIFRYGEMIYPGNEDSQNTNEYYTGLYGPDGTYRKGVAGRILYDTNRAAMDTDFYTVDENDINQGYVEIEPDLTYRSYRYMQITVPGRTSALDLADVQRKVVSSVQDTTYSYNATTTDTALTGYVNQLLKNITNSQLSNFMTIPTDCPQRNERMGWTGDAQAYSLTSTYVSDSDNFFRQWMQVLRDDQGPDGYIGQTAPDYITKVNDGMFGGTTWAAAVCVVPWRMYTQFGDTQIIKENMDTMTKWLDGMAAYPMNKMPSSGGGFGGSSSSEDAEDLPYKYLSSQTTGLADWLSVDGTTSSDICNNAIYIYCMDIVAKMAKAVGEVDIAKKYEERSALTKEEYNKCYWNDDLGVTVKADGSVIDSQSSYAIGLNYGVWNEEHAAKAAERLAVLAKTPSQSQNGASTKEYPNWSITTGFAGTPNVLPALTKSGNADYASNMFTCTDYASWLYGVTMGATSMWERWNSYELAFQDGGESSMNSFNHFALGASGAWAFEYQLGISNGAEDGKDGGYQDFVLQPSAGGKFTALEGSYDSSYGTIKSSWTADSTTDANGDATAAMNSYSCTVPANTTATVYLPADFKDAKINTSCVTYKDNETHNGKECAVFEVKSGAYNFSKDSVNLDGSYFEKDADEAKFEDVQNKDSYYYEPVYWAVNKGITKGTSETAFSPNADCTREQIVTFLYRAAGSPDVSDSENPFTDVKEDMYSYDAILWAAKNGITKGKTDTTFAPKDTCTREQAVTFLYRASGSPEISADTAIPFTDVKSDSYAVSAIQWAASNGVTIGTTETTFSPKKNCTRAEIVTFLWRSANQ